MRTAIVLAALMLGTACEAVAQTPPSQSPAQHGQMSLRCSFERGNASAAETGKAFATKPAKDKIEITFAALNIVESRAQMHGPGGPEDVLLIDGEAGLTFLEITPTGGSHLTTVYTVPAGEQFAAVHSRHGGSRGKAAVSQHFGSCQVLR